MKRAFNPRKVGMFLAWAILLLPIYKGYTWNVPLLENIYDIGRYISIFVCIIICIKYFNIFIQEHALIMLFFAKLYIVILTLIMNVKNMDCLYSFIWVVLQGILFTYMLKKDSQVAFQTFTFVFEVIVYINLITLILHPEGLYNFEADRIYTFLGHANNTVYYTLPLATLAIISWKKELSHTRALVDILACIASAILIGSATGAVVLVCFALLLIWEQKKTKRIHWSYFVFYIIIVLISCGFIFFNLQSIFGVFIEKVLHRQLNFTGRTYYWNKAILEIEKSLLFGHGAVPGNLRPGGLSAHSFFLETLYEGGIVLFSMFSLFFYKISCILKKHKNLQVTKVLFSAIAAITITCISESNISYDIFFVLFIWGTQINSFDKINRVKKNKWRLL